MQGVVELEKKANLSVAASSSAPTPGRAGRVAVGPSNPANRVGVYGTRSSFCKS